MPPNVIAFAVPFFLAAIVAERWFLGRKGDPYRFGAAIADLDTGISSQIVDAFLKVGGLFVYGYAYAHWRAFTFDEGSVLPWVIGLVAIDFFYYWWHRCSHVVNVLWAVHAVHHQSEEFNLAVALRQPAFEAITIIPFHLPLALLGIPPSVYVVSYSLDLVYQFWIHTEVVGRLGPLEKVLNTPSGHRVHHGINPGYLDKNYGGILIIWDRIFGTYAPEAEPVVYGVTKPLQSYNPLWSNLAPLFDVAALSRQVPGLLGKLKVWLLHPAWRPVPQPTADAPSRATFRKYDPAIPRSVARYVAVHFLLLLGASGAFMFFADRLPWGPLVVPAILLLLSAAALGGWCEGRSWARPLDVARQLAVGPTVFFYSTSSLGTRAAVGMGAGAAAVLTMLFVVLAPAALPRGAQGAGIGVDQRR
jgi:sterol desaturase/sphingolipid hydroxylase (fatty acid hydroxylase superfamily)